MGILAACAGAPTPTIDVLTQASINETATPLPTVTLRPGTPNPNARPTLPPSFTPTFTPTVTDTPTVTPTATRTLTPTAVPENVLCNAFFITFNESADGVFNIGEVLLLQVFMEYAAVFVNFEAVHEDSGEIITFTREGGGPLIAPLAASSFPESGRYNWTASLFDGTRSGLCVQSGSFVIDLTPLATLEATAAVRAEETESASAQGEATAEATAEITVDLTVEATVELTEESTAEATAELTEESTAEATAELTEESTAEATAELTEESTPEVTRDPDDSAF